MRTLLMAPPEREEVSWRSPTAKESANYLERILSAWRPPPRKARGVPRQVQPPHPKSSPLLLYLPFTDQGGRSVVWGAPLPNPLVWEYRGK